MVIRHGQAAIVEEPPQRGLLPHGIAEGGGDQAAGVLDAGVLLLGPGEEVVDEPSRDELSPVMPLRRRQLPPLGLDAIVEERGPSIAVSASRARAKGREIPTWQAARRSR